MAIQFNKIKMINKNFFIICFVAVFVIIPIIVTYHLKSKKSNLIDLQTDSANCGTIGNDCNANGTNYVCTAGVCNCPDQTQCTCDGNLCSGRNQTCTNSGCQCENNLTYCGNADPFCYNLSTGTVIADGQAQGSFILSHCGQCLPRTFETNPNSYLSDIACCSGSPRNLLEDDFHCGACGNVCPEGQYCSVGACQ